MLTLQKENDILQKENDILQKKGRWYIFIYY